MTRQKAQIVATLIRTASRALAHGFVLLLLFTHLSWAGVICSCNHPDGSEHAFCHRAQRDNMVVETHQEGSDTLPSHCTRWETLCPAAEFDVSSRHVMACCHSAQGAGAQAVAASSTNQLPVEKLASPFRIGEQTIVTPASVYIHPRRQNLPLYLAFSCWLI